MKLTLTVSGLWGSLTELGSGEPVGAREQHDNNSFGSCGGAKTVEMSWLYTISGCI